MKSAWFSDAAMILALCLGLATCSVSDHVNKYLDAKADALKVQTK